MTFALQFNIGDAPAAKFSLLLRHISASGTS